MSPRYPIKLKERLVDDSYTFSSLERALHYLEQTDIEDDVYDGWDADGRRLRFVLTGERRNWLRIELADEINFTGAADAPSGSAR